MGTEVRAIDRVNKRITKHSLAVVGIVLMIIILYFPIGIPLSVSPPTQDFFDSLNARSKGDKVAFGITMGSIPLYNYYATGFASVVNYMVDRGLKIIFIPGDPDSLTGVLDLFKRVDFAGKKYVYGVDYMVMPFTTGAEVGMAAIAADMRGLFEKDPFGNVIADLDIMQGVNTIGDVQLTVTTYYGFDEGPRYVRQWASKYNVPMLTIADFATTAQYYKINVFGNLYWVRGLAEFEFLAKKPGVELISMDMRNVLAFLCFGTIIVGNLARIGRRAEKVQGEATKK